ncbi:MAG: CehA/McbA family metallohydrolase [Ferruginibacter sp.]
MNKRLFTIIVMMVLVGSGGLTFGQSRSKSKSASLKIDGSKRFQQIDGIGVNANTQGWDGEKLKPAINLLLDSMHASIWRVVVETVYNWEDRNDNNDPFVFKWDYYNELYETPKFRKAWDMIKYLNNQGVTNNLMINFMGPIPLWMGGKIVKEKYEDEYIEMLVSFFYYAKNVKHLQIGLISIMNEPDIENEGPTVDAKQYAHLLRKFIDRMQSLGLGDIKYVAPDVAGMDNGVKTYIPELMKDSAVMSKIAHIGLHSYGGYYAPIDSLLKHSAYPEQDFWMTEWNNWCNGCDDGKLGEYNYDFAAKCVDYLLQFLKNGATAGIVWEGYDSYYEHHAPSPFSYWGMLAYDSGTKTYTPRKNFYAIQQISKFVLPGWRRISISGIEGSLVTQAFYDQASGDVSIVGINKSHNPVIINGSLENLPGIKSVKMYYTNNTENLHRGADVQVKGKVFKTTIPADCIFTLTSMAPGSKILLAVNQKPEPPDWYTGDIHVHLNCGEGTIVLPENKLAEMMEPNDLDVISVLADMGNGEVQDSKRDLPKVNGQDAPQSIPGRIIHWDTEWHWDATYSNFSNQALGGHLVLLGLQNAHQMWEESPYKILEWAGKQNAVRGFAHLEYLNDSVQNELNCCIPIDYPVETALGTIDFLSEDVYGKASPNNGNYFSEGVINAYYKLLNCGFRPGLAAGTDYPCNDNEPLGTLLTYVNVKDKLTYQKWIDGIKDGRTVVSRNGHNEFLEMKVNAKYTPGDEIKMTSKGTVAIAVKWTAIKELTGRVELVSNGQVIASQSGSAKPGEPLILESTTAFTKSGWICARRMDDQGHETHTAPVYITVNNKSVRASADDARFFITWIDNILENIKPGAKWNKYFPNDLATVQARYITARGVYEKILKECNEK